MNAQARPQIVLVSIEELRANLEQVRGLIPQEIHQRFALGFESFKYVLDLLAAKESTLRKLRQMIFGEQSEKRDKIFPPGAEPQAGAGGAAAGPSTAAESPAHAKSEKPQGHGRNGAGEYAGAERVAVPHPELQSGGTCPDCQKGKVYALNEPGQIMRIVGAPLLQAKLYEPARYRCNLCGKTFTAPLPPEAGEKKYDETAGSMIALAKYGSGIPFHRLEKMQESLGVPLPAATQWELVAEVARQAKPAYESLLNVAAQGAVLHNDDTDMTVLSLEKENRELAALDEGAAQPGNETSSTTPPLEKEDKEAEVPERSVPGAVRPAADPDLSMPGREQENQEPAPPERKGVFTSGIVAESQGHKLGLFFTGRKHAGERLADLLKRRATNLGAPIQMCDALSRNLPQEFKTILANCLAHGRRKFVEQAESFPAECRYVLDRLAEVYRVDEQAREQGLSPEQRLALHQSVSGPVMQKLHEWLTAQLAEKKVEPNSGLGGAISYMLKHWAPLTLFLRQAGAPLDNNICERALKMAILHRKNALFYKTETGALVGDILMSLIHTCRLNGVNPFEYLTALQRHAPSVRESPARWLPWNYQEQLPSSPTDTG
jgi:transposase